MHGGKWNISAGLWRTMHQKPRCKADTVGSQPMVKAIFVVVKSLQGLCGAKAFEGSRLT